MSKRHDSISPARQAARSVLLLGLLCCQSAGDVRCLFAEKSAAVGKVRCEPGGVRELPAPTSQPVLLANPDFEQQWDGWTPQDQEGFSMETQPGAARSGKSCLRFDCGRLAAAGVESLHPAGS